MNQLLEMNGYGPHLPDDVSSVATVRSGDVQGCVMVKYLLTTAVLSLFVVGCGREEKAATAEVATEKSEQNNSSTSPASRDQPGNNKAGSTSKELLDEIGDAISMIEATPDAFFSSDFLHPWLRMRLQFGSNHTSGSEVMTEYELNNLRWHLESSLNAEFKLDSDKSFAVARYELSESNKPAASDSNTNSFEDQKPSGSVPGLGDDLKAMLSQAAALVESGKLEEFVNSVYPVADVARFKDPDEMQQQLERIQNEAMKSAMIRDLKDAAAAAHQVQGDLATVSLAPLVEGDPDRQFKFEKVDGHWRFIDSDKEERLELVNYLTQQSSGQAKPTQGVIVFTRTESGWKIFKMPTTE